MKKLLFLFFSFLFLSKVYALPNNQMSISPSATDNTVITAADENTRNSETSTKYNAHSHTDISQTGNTLAVGDGVVGDKTVTANNADSNKPYIKFEDTNNKWAISADGVVTGLSVTSLGAVTGISIRADTITAVRAVTGVSVWGNTVTAGDVVTGLTVWGNFMHIQGATAKLYIGQPDGGCSSCGVDNAGTVWSCSDVTCP